MAQTILIKFCTFIEHSKPNNMTLSAFPGKIPETEKKNSILLCGRRLTERLTHLTNLVQIRYLGPLANISIPFLVLFLDFRRKTRLIKQASVCVRVCVCVCVYVCVCGKFWSPLTISKPAIRLIRNLGYIQYRTGTLQRHLSRFLILKIVPGRNF